MKYNEFWKMLNLNDKYLELDNGPRTLIGPGE